MWRPPSQENQVQQRRLALFEMTPHTATRRDLRGTPARKPRWCRVLEFAEEIRA